MKTRILALGVVALFLGLSIGCEEDDQEDIRDHQPPAGFGSLIVDNRTPAKLRVYVNGQEQTDVDDFAVRAYDFPPGIYRVILDEKDGKGNFSRTIDVLMGQRTILDVMEKYLDEEFHVEVSYD